MSISKLKDEARRHEQKEEWDKAITAYLQVLRIGDDAGDVELPLYNRIGDLCVRLGRAGDAVRYYEQAADRYAEVGLYNNAMALCNKALRYRPDHVALLRKLGQFSALQGFLTEARDYYVDYADQQIRTGHADAAFDALRDFANIVGDGDTRELLGRRLRSQGRDGEAVTELQRAYALHLQAGNATAAQAVAAEILAVDPAATLSDVAHADGDHGAGPGLADGGELPRLDDLAIPTMAPDPDVWVDADEDAGGIDDGLADEADSTPEPSSFGGFVGGVDADAEMYGVMRFGSDPEDSADADVGDEDAGVDEDALADGVLEVEGRDGTNLVAGSGSPGPTGLDLGLDFDAVQADAASDDPASWERDDGLAPGGDDGAFDETDYGLPLLGDDPPAFDLPLLGDTGPGEADDDRLPYIGDTEHPSAPWRIGEFEDAAGFEPASYEGTEGGAVAGDPGADEPWAGMSGDDPEAGGADDSDDDAPPDHEFDSALFDAAAFGIPVIRGSPSEPPAHGAPADGFDPVAGPMADWFAGPRSPDADDTAAQSDVDATGVAGGEAVGDAEDGWPRAADADAPLPAEDVSAAGADDPWAWEPPAGRTPDATASPDLTSAGDEAEDKTRTPGGLPGQPAEGLDDEQSADAMDAAERIAAAGYVDLRELLREDREQTTRFRMAEAEPTGDEDRDFAELLGQFRARLSEHLPVEDGAAHYDLALAFKEMGLLDEAIAEFQVSLRGGYSRLRIYEELGSCFLQKEEYAIAEKVLNQALRLEPADDLDLLGVYYHLGRAYEAMGQAPQAREAYEHVLAMDISFQDVSERLERL
jgi:tetratricopeptide (TPR) repeat protein